MSDNEVLCLVEKLRVQLIALAKDKPLVDPDIVKLSQMIDSFLNLYQHTLSKLSRETLT